MCIHLNLTCTAGHCAWFPYKPNRDCSYNDGVDGISLTKAMLSNFPMRWKENPSPMAKGKEPDLNIQKTADVAQLFYWKTSAWVLSEKRYKIVTGAVPFQNVLICTLKCTNMYLSGVNLAFVLQGTTTVTAFLFSEMMDTRRAIF